MRRSLMLGALVLALVGCGRQSASGLSAREEAHLVELGVLNRGEKVLFFASSTGLKQEGNFFTDERVVAYWLEPDWTERPERDQQGWARYEEISEISMEYAMDWSYAHDITVTRQDGSAFHVYVPAEKAFADDFFRALTETWEANK